MIRSRIRRLLAGYLIGNLARFAISVVVGVATFETLAVLVRLGDAGSELPLGDAITGYVFSLGYFALIGTPLAAGYLVFLRAAQSFAAHRASIIVGAVITGLVFVAVIFRGSLFEGIQGAWLSLVPWAMFGCLIHRPVGAPELRAASS